MNALRSELDRFRVAYAHHLEKEVEPINLAAVEEGFRIVEALVNLTAQIDAIRMDLGTLKGGSP